MKDKDQQHIGGKLYAEIQDGCLLLVVDYGAEPNDNDYIVISKPTLDNLLRYIGARWED